MKIMSFTDPIKCVIFSTLCLFVSACSSVNEKTASENNVDDDSFSIAVAGDWDDHWGERYSSSKKTLTYDSVLEAGKSDLIVLVGDLSYGRDKLATPQLQAQRWCDVSRKVSNNTPMIFVPGDHDSDRQDGDVATYANCLTKPSANADVNISEPQHDNYAQYPYLYYVDVNKGGTTLRIVATSIAFQEEESEPAEAQKYFKEYEKGSANYRWLEKTYNDAKEKDYWIIHINHLPCIDMGKNQSFGQGCADVVNLGVEYGVNVLLTGSSHNIWRTHLFSHSKDCPEVPLTKTKDGANPACVDKSDRNVFVHGQGLVQAHAGAGGKTKASKRAIPCDPQSDGEAAHYLAPKTCGVNNVTGFVRLDVSANELSADYVLTKSKTLFEPYSFKFVKDGSK